MRIGSTPPIYNTTDLFLLPDNHTTMTIKGTYEEDWIHLYASHRRQTVSIQNYLFTLIWIFYVEQNFGIARQRGTGI